MAQPNVFITNLIGWYKTSVDNFIQLIYSSKLDSILPNSYVTFWYSLTRNDENKDDGKNIINVYAAYVPNISIILFLILYEYVEN